MKKVVNSRKGRIVLLMLLSSLLTGCNLEEDMKLTEVEKKYESIYDNSFKKMGEELVKFEDLDNADFYLINEETPNGTTHTIRLLKIVEKDDYVALVNRVDGSIYSLKIDNPSKYDKFNYKGYLDDKELIYLESLMDEIEDQKYTKYIREGLDFDNKTITVDSLELLVATYQAHNKIK